MLQLPYSYSMARLQFIEQIKEVLDEGSLEKYMKIVDRLMEDDYSSVDIAAALVKMTVGNNEENTDEYKDSDFDNSLLNPGWCVFSLTSEEIIK